MPSIHYWEIRLVNQTKICLKQTGSVDAGSLAPSISRGRFTVTELLAGIDITLMSSPLLSFSLHPSVTTSFNILIRLNTSIVLLSQGRTVSYLLNFFEIINPLDLHIQDQPFTLILPDK